MTNIWLRICLMARLFRLFTMSASSMATARVMLAAWVAATLSSVIALAAGLGAERPWGLLVLSCATLALDVIMLRWTLIGYAASRDLRDARRRHRAEDLEFKRIVNELR